MHRELCSMRWNSYSAYSVETIERVFRRMRPVDTSDSSSGGGIKALSATNQLVGLRQRLNAGLSARLLEMKAEMDKEFGTAFVDMESYLRTERGRFARWSGFLLLSSQTQTGSLDDDCHHALFCMLPGDAKLARVHSLLQVDQTEVCLPSGVSIVFAIAARTTPKVRESARKSRRRG